MQNEMSSVVWLDRSQRITIAEMIAVSGLSEFELLELVDAGALVREVAADEPVAPVAPIANWTFAADSVPMIRRAARLREELELDIHALVLAVKLLDRIRGLESELSTLRARQSMFTGY